MTPLITVPTRTFQGSGAPPDAVPVVPKMEIALTIFAAVISASPAPDWRAPVLSKYSKAVADFTWALNVAAVRSAEAVDPARGLLAFG